MERPPTPEAYQRISQNLQFLHSWKMQRLIIKGQDQNMRSSSQILLVFRITNSRLSLSLTFKSKFSAQPQLVAGAVEAGKRSLSAGQHWLFTCCRTEWVLLSNNTEFYNSSICSRLVLQPQLWGGMMFWTQYKIDVFCQAVGMLSESCHDSLIFVFCYLEGWG